MFKYLKNQPFRIKFLVFVIVLYLIAMVLDFDYTLEAFVNTFVLFVKIIPILIFVFVLNFLVNQYLKIETIKKHIGEKNKFLQYFYAALFGIFISGAPYLLYPMLGDLKRKGVRDDFIAVMLFNRNVKIPFIPVMIYYFGLAYTVIISILIIAFSVLNGLLVSILVVEKNRN
ncbi:hypothetical protein C0583_07070 [Candidatus Parcubacteria bacterium]|nr:MAG: hypothetical protein C0583_07070 [Candidatus Parcubacteria bacterium]